MHDVKAAQFADTKDRNQPCLPGKRGQAVQIETVGGAHPHPEENKTSTSFTFPFLFLLTRSRST
jgi:hypothetical protein